MEQSEDTGTFLALVIILFVVVVSGFAITLFRKGNVEFVKAPAREQNQEPEPVKSFWNSFSFGEINN